MRDDAKRETLSDALKLLGEMGADERLFWLREFVRSFDVAPDLSLWIDSFIDVIDNFGEETKIRWVARTAPLVGSLPDDLRARWLGATIDLESSIADDLKPDWIRIAFEARETIPKHLQLKLADRMAGWYSFVPTELRREFVLWTAEHQELVTAEILELVSDDLKPEWIRIAFQVRETIPRRTRQKFAAHLIDWQEFMPEGLRRDFFWWAAENQLHVPASLEPDWDELSTQGKVTWLRHSLASPADVPDEGSLRWIERGVALWPELPADLREVLMQRTLDWWGSLPPDPKVKLTEHVLDSQYLGEMPGTTRADFVSSVVSIWELLDEFYRLKFTSRSYSVLDETRDQAVTKKWRVHWVLNAFEFWDTLPDTAKTTIISSTALDFTHSSAVDSFDRQLWLLKSIEVLPLMDFSQRVTFVVWELISISTWEPLLDELGSDIKGLWMEVTTPVVIEARDAGTITSELYDTYQDIVMKSIVDLKRQKRELEDTLIAEAPLDEAFGEIAANGWVGKLGPPPEARILKTPEDAEASACDWMRHLGFVDAAVTPPGRDGGIDVDSTVAVAQVKAEMKPIGRPPVQQIKGVAATTGKQALFFSLSGYTAEAVEWANQAQVALFEFDYSGTIKAVNRPARSLLGDS